MTCEKCNEIDEFSGRELESKLKRIEDAIDKGILAIDKDERFHYEPACVQTNAPLALVQTDLEARMDVLNKIKKILQEKEK